MKPSFALILSHDGIVLLHRAGDGWRKIGETAPEDPELAKNLRYLRQTATELSGGAFATKLVLPASQILFQKIDALGATDERRLKVIRKALDGQTPYSLDQLAIDWCDAGSGWAHVAVVAHETLEEAETFATEHKFNPVSYVAIPPEGTFGREVFFGRTRFADQLIGRDEIVEPDKAVLHIVGADEPRTVDAPPDPTPAAEPGEFPAVDNDAQTEPAADAAEPDDTDGPATTVEKDTLQAVEARDAESEEKTATEPENGQDEGDEPELVIDIEPAVDAVPPVEGPSPADAPVPSIAFASSRAHDDSSAPAEPLELKWVAPRIAIDVGRKDRHELDDEPPLTGKGQKKLKEGTITAPSIAAERPKRRAKLRKSRKRGETGRVATPVLVRRIPKAPPEPSQRQKEAEALTIFGARGKETAKDPRRAVAPGIYLSLVAAIGLVAVAATVVFDAPVTSSQFWRSLSGQSATGETAAPMVAAAEFVEVETLPEDTGPTVGVEMASLNVPDITPEDIIFPGTEAGATDDSDLAAEPDLPDDGLSAEEILALTGVWSAAPEPPSVPQLDRVGEIYLASIDRAVVTSDAVAIATVSRLAPDVPHARIASPPPAGTKFDMDDRGLVQATPEGAVTPEGVVVYAGAPSIRPPLRPGSAVPVVPPDALRAELAKLRPIARPEGLVTEHERTRLGGRTMAEIAALRPIARPESAQDQKAPQNADALVMASSVVPFARPRDLSTAVQKALVEAVASAPANSAEELQAEPEVAAAAPPPLPTKANVAEQATIDNALRLSSINLIGIYGTANDRRALVRLRNGRYVKVQVGDALDGGRVTSISASELLYVKAGRSVTLRMPTG